MLLRIVSLALIVLGEGLAILAEIVAAHVQDKSGQSPWDVFLRGSLAMVLASLLLIGGYMLGVRAFRSIWVVGAVSIGAIVILEPLIAYAVFRELPTRGPALGMALGIVGVLVATIVP